MALLLRLSVALAAALLLVPAAASAARDQARLDKTVRYLQDVQNKDGGFGQPRSDGSFSFWAAMAFASAGINPRDQRAGGGVDLYTYLTRHTDGFTESTEFARVILVARAAGASPRKFGPIDPVARLLKLQRPDGGFPQPPSASTSQVNGTEFAILALAGIEGLDQRVSRAVDWLLAQQAEDGSFGGDTDQTGAAIEALNAAGRRDTPQQRKALAYLRARQNADGGFSYRTPGDGSNAASTSWVVRGLIAAKIPATSIRAAGARKTPLDFLAASQQADGSVRNSATDDTNPEFITSFTTSALAGVSLPIAAVDRERPRSKNDADPSPKRTRGDDDPQRGAGGTAAGGDGDVTAGGGGQGADLFSRPQPGSQGRAPGGERDTEKPRSSPLPGSAAQPSGDSVVGKLVGRNSTLAAGPNRRLGTAPGLRAAAAGGTAPPGLVAGLGAALALCALGGVYLERRRKA